MIVNEDGEGVTLLWFDIIVVWVNTKIGGTVLRLLFDIPRVTCIFLAGVSTHTHSRACHAIEAHTINAIKAQLGGLGEYRRL